MYSYIFLIFLFMFYLLLCSHIFQLIQCHFFLIESEITNIQIIKIVKTFICLQIRFKIIKTWAPLHKMINTLKYYRKKYKQLYDTTRNFLYGFNIRSSYFSNQNIVDCLVCLTFFFHLRLTLYIFMMLKFKCGLKFYIFMMLKFKCD